MKKILLGLIGTLLITSTSFGYVKIYDIKSNETPISSGVVYQNIKRFTTTGWLNINMLKVDLTDKYTQIDMLTSQDGLYNLDTVKNQATENEAVAAVNGEFFSWITGETGKGYPVGFGIKEGTVTSTPYYKNAVSDTMATFLLDTDKNPIYEYIKMTDLSVENEDGETLKIAEINKISSDYLSPIIYNFYWNTYSIGNTKFNDMLEIVVQKDKIKEIRENKEAVEIPDNGYVICARGEAADTLKDMFRKGDEIKLNIEANIDLDDIDTALSGGAILVKDGAVVNGFTHTISGYNPRTAIGTDKDGETLYMVTVDGRGTSKGVTQNEMAYLMNELGSWNAINFDGGGSTAMVGRIAGENSLTTLNNPTENRKVVNSIGVISTAPSSSLDEIIITADSDRVLVDNEVKLTVKGYDKYINPIEIDIDDVTFKVTGVKGSVENGVFKPTTTGTATITATYKKVKTSIEIKVSEIATLDLGKRIVEIAEGQVYTPTITARDEDGYEVVVDPLDLTFTTSNNYCSIDDTGKITGEKLGQTLITAKLGNVKAFIGVVVSGSGKEIVDDFEKLEVEFSGYPSEEVEGKVSRVSSINHDGKYSLRLSYDFSNTDKTRGAYAKYLEPITIDETVFRINLWTYTKRKNEDVNVKMQITDANGKEHLVTLGALDFKGWEELSYDITDIALPAKLDRIYVAQVAGEEGKDSDVYFDDLSFEMAGKGDISKIKVPNNTSPKDEMESEAKEDRNSIKVAFIGNTSFGNTLFDTIRENKINNIAKNADVVISENIIDKANEMITTSGYNIYEEDSTAFITLDTASGGININKWSWFIEQLEEIDVDNLFIILPEGISNFTDSQEKELFEKLLREHDSNVIVLHPGDINGYYMLNGVKYIIVDRNKVEDIDTQVDNEKYIEFVINDDEVTYQIKSIY